jgi:hypothetical protein
LVIVQLLLIKIVEGGRAKRSMTKHAYMLLLRGGKHIFRVLSLGGPLVPKVLLMGQSNGSF